MTFLANAKLSDRGVLGISGPDRIDFLQRLVTQDVTLLAPERPLYSLLLSPQGRFLYDFFLYADPAGETIWLETARIWVEDLQQRLARYRLRSKVTLTDRSQDFVSMVFWRQPENDKNIFQNSDLGAGGLLPDPRLPALGWRALVPSAQGAALPEAEPQTETVYDLHRMCLGVPDGLQNLVCEQSLPAEFNLDLLNAISFTKGCYVGQELTARMHYRALLKYRVLTVLGASLPERGEQLCDMSGRVLGEMVGCGEGVGLVRIALVALPAFVFAGNDLAKESVISAPLPTRAGDVTFILQAWQRSVVLEELLGKI